MTLKETVFPIVGCEKGSADHVHGRVQGPIFVSWIVRNIEFKTRASAVQTSFLALKQIALLMFKLNLGVQNSQFLKMLSAKLVFVRHMPEKLSGKTFNIRFFSNLTAFVVKLVNGQLIERSLSDIMISLKRPFGMKPLFLLEKVSN